MGRANVELRENQLYADDFAVGQVYEGSEKIVDRADFETFAELTGDRHPIHYDVAYAATTTFGRPVAHGLLLVAMTAFGATPLTPRLESAMIALVEQDFRFLNPVFAGDLVQSRFRVSAIEPKSDRGTALVRFDVDLRKADGQVVMTGHHAYLLHLRPIQKPATAARDD